MTKQEKIASLKNAMTRKSRVESPDNDDVSGDMFYVFTPDAPKGLKDLFLECYDVRDLDYEIFSTAIDVLVDIYNDTEQENDGLEFVEDMIYDSGEHASIWTEERLGYLNVMNEEEISRMVDGSIAQACAMWYDSQVERAAVRINEWINP